MSKKATDKKAKTTTTDNPVEFTVINSGSKRQPKPSVKRMLDGVGESTVLYSRRIEHPNGDTYDNEKSVNYGKVKIIAQYSRNADFTDLIDWEQDVPSVAMYELVEMTDSKGEAYKKAVKSQLRFPDIIMTTEKKRILKEQATLTAMAAISYKVLDVFNGIDKLIEGTQHKLQLDAVNQMSNFISNGTTEKLTLLLNKANGVRMSKSDELFDYGA